LNQVSLAVGNDHYPHCPANNLTGCIEDAKTWRDRIFVDGLQYNLDQCNIIFDGDKAALGYGLNLLVKNISWLELVLWSQSCHGTPLPCPEEADGVEGAIVCSDVKERGDDWDPATLFTETEVSNILAVLPLTCLFEAFFDLCFAGDFAEPGERVLGRGRRLRYLPPRRRTFKPLLHRVLASRGGGQNTVIWAACGPEQTSAEAYIHGKAQGAFTAYFAREFQPDMPRGELLARVTAALKSNGYSQRPMLSCSETLRGLPVGKMA
jgi:hypothetical protein